MQINWPKLHQLYCCPHLFILLQESMSESSSQENGFVAVENVKSSDITDNGSLSTDLYVHVYNGFCFRIDYFLCYSFRLMCVNQEQRYGASIHCRWSIIDGRFSEAMQCKTGCWTWIEYWCPKCCKCELEVERGGYWCPIKWVWEYVCVCVWLMFISQMFVVIRNCSEGKHLNNFVLNCSRDVWYSGLGKVFEF